MKSLAEFETSLSETEPPSRLSNHLLTLWYDAKGEWNKSHTIIQNIEDKNAAWIHAYLHRKEGDTGNADYWYSHAGRKRPTSTLREEWEDMVKYFL